MREVSLAYNNASVKYDGIIIAHGSDTLSYTSAVIELFFGDLNIPVILTAADHPLEDPHSNGNRNFAACVDYIRGNNESGVYTIYEDNKGNMNVYNSHTICEADGYLDQYHDMTGEVYGVMDNGSFVRNEKYVLPRSYSETHGIKKILAYGLERRLPEQQNHSAIEQEQNEEALEADMGNSSISISNILRKKVYEILEGTANMTDNVLFIRPYPGLRYDNISFESNKPSCVLHGLYHAGTADVNRFVMFIEYCNNNGVPVYIAPVKHDTEAVYATHSSLIQNGAQPLYDINYETAYALLVIMSAY